MTESDGGNHTIWAVSLYRSDRGGREMYYADAPHRAGAKQYILDRLPESAEVTEWDQTYRPRPTWDCPKCNGHEAMTKLANLRTRWDWECMRPACGYRTIGHPCDPEETKRP